MKRNARIQQNHLSTRGYRLSKVNPFTLKDHRKKQCFGTGCVTFLVPRIRVICKDPDSTSTVVWISVFRIRIGFNADPYPNPLLSQCGSRSGSEGANPMRVRIRIQSLVRLCRHKKFDFDMKNLLYVGNRVCHKTYLCKYKNRLEWLKIRLFC
jgi:hypothetical protein